MNDTQAKREANRAPANRDVIAQGSQEVLLGSDRFAH